MPINKKFLVQIECGHIYHIYNKTNDKEPLFRFDEDYYLFLQLFKKYIALIADVFAWSLLPNHFHFLIRIKSEAEIERLILQIPVSERTVTQKHFLSNPNMELLAESQFRRLFTAYAMAYNKLYERRGNLFNRQYKRVRITHDQNFTNALVYIHANGLKHKLVEDFWQYKWTSYHLIVNNQKGDILKDEIIDWFGSMQNFISVHEENSDYYYKFRKSIEL